MAEHESAAMDVDYWLKSVLRSSVGRNAGAHSPTGYSFFSEDAFAGKYMSVLILLPLTSL
jgi:hypothetical protein